MNNLFHWRKKLEITDECLFRGEYLGNISTLDARNCSHSLSLIAEKNSISSNTCRCGIVLNTDSLRVIFFESEDEDIFDLYRITSCCLGDKLKPSQKLLVAWVYRHEYKKFKVVYKCHVVQLTSRKLVELLTSQLYATLTLGFKEYKKALKKREESRQLLEKVSDERYGEPPLRWFLLSPVRKLRYMRRNPESFGSTGLTTVVEEDETEEQSNQVASRFNIDSSYVCSGEHPDEIAEFYRVEPSRLLNKSERSLIYQ